MLCKVISNNVQLSCALGPWWLDEVVQDTMFLGIGESSVTVKVHFYKPEGLHLRSCSTQFGYDFLAVILKSLFNIRFHFQVAVLIALVVALTDNLQG